MQSNSEKIDVDRASSSADVEVDGSDGWTGSGHGHSRSDRDLHRELDSGSHQRLPPSVPELKHLVTSLQLELKESQATHMRTRYGLRWFGTFNTVQSQFRLRILCFFGIFFLTRASCLSYG